MTALPPALRPWAPWMDELTPELQGVLARWLPRLSLAVGPFRGRDERGAGEPDGYEGLSRRGDYERLSVAEWLLADEVPDEFLRRAAEGEHLFLHRVNRAPARSRRCLVVFDTGPDQLGAPRLAHLALLIVLARRASAAGAELCWTAAAGGDFRSGAGTPDLAALLDARTPRRPSSEGLEQALAELRARAAGTAEEVVWVGGAAGAERLRSLCRTVRAVVVDDPVGVQRDHIAVGVDGRPPVRLDLPPSEVQVRLLRGRLRAGSGRTYTGAEAASMRLDRSGYRLLIDGGDRVVAHSVPNSVRASPGRDIVIERAGVAAAAVRHRCMWALVPGGGEVEIVLARKGGGTRTHAVAPGDLPSGDGLGTLFTQHGGLFVYHDPGTATVYAVRPRGVEQIGADVVGEPWSDVRHEVCWLTWDHAGPRVEAVCLKSGVRSVKPPEGFDELAPMVAPLRTSSRLDKATRVALATGPGRWQLYDSRRLRRQPVLRGVEGGRALGVYVARDGVPDALKWTPTVLSVCDDARLVLRGGGREHTLWTAARPIVAASASPRNGLYAVLDDDGGVTVRSVNYAATLREIRR